MPAFKCRITDTAAPRDWLTFTNELIQFCKVLVGVNRDAYDEEMIKVTVGFHRATKNPHTHIHVWMSGIKLAGRPAYAYNSPLQFWRSGAKKWNLPPAPEAVGKDISLKYDNDVDADRILGYPLKECDTPERLEECSPFCKGFTQEALRILAAAANAEYKVRLQDARRLAERDAAASARRDKLYAFLDESGARTWNQIGLQLSKHYLLEYKEVPNFSSSQSKITTYMLARGYMSHLAYAKLTRPRGYEDPITIPEPPSSPEDVPMYLESVRRNFG